VISALHSQRLPETHAASHGAPAQIVAAVRQASDRTGVDFAYLMEKAAVESGYRTEVKAKTSSATGLFQFTEGTWLQMVQTHGAKHGLGRYAQAIDQAPDGARTVENPQLRREILDLRKDPRLSALLAAELANDNKTRLENELGRPVGKTEMYLAHFLGAGGAAKLLKATDQNPNQPAAGLLPEAARANRSVFYDELGRPRTVGQIYDCFAGRFGDTSQFADSTAFGTVQAEDHTSQPWLSVRSAGTAREPLSTFTVMMLNALAAPGEEKKKNGMAGDEADEDGQDQRRAPNLLAGLTSL